MLFLWNISLLLLLYDFNCPQSEVDVFSLNAFFEATVKSGNFRTAECSPVNYLKFSFLINTA